jgi:hypothetical protein
MWKIIRRILIRERTLLGFSAGVTRFDWPLKQLKRFREYWSKNHRMSRARVLPRDRLQYIGDLVNRANLLPQIARFL